MQQQGFTFIDRTGLPYPSLRLTDPVIVTKEQIDTEVDYLASLPAPENGRRVALLCNPATGVGNGFTHGTAVSICVLKPGERTQPVRHNSSLVNFCIRGGGHAIISGKRIDYTQYDVWNTPPWAVYQDFNDTDELQTRLTYSNGPLLEKLNIHIVDEDPFARRSSKREDDHSAGAQHPFGNIKLGDDGALLIPYEKLISPDVVEMEALHWPWKKVKAELDKLTALGKSYVGRRLYLLYHPATGRTNGTTWIHFATMCVRPANIVDKPHRHTAAAINYFFAGSGNSIIEGKKYFWKAGDLMLTAPGWAIHRHASDDQDVYELTIQDTPLNIYMGSLLWQEDLSQPVESLGVTGGFETNRPVHA